MYKLSNLCFNCAYLLAFLFLLLCWSLDPIEVWLSQVVIPTVTVCVILGFLFKYIAVKLGHEPPQRKKAQEAKINKETKLNTKSQLNDDEQDLA